MFTHLFLQGSSFTRRQSVKRSSAAASPQTHQNLPSHTRYLPASVGKCSATLGPTKSVRLRSIRRVCLRVDSVSVFVCACLYACVRCWWQGWCCSCGLASPEYWWWFSSDVRPSSRPLSSNPWGTQEEFGETCVDDQHWPQLILIKC